MLSCQWLGSGVWSCGSAQACAEQAGRLPLVGENGHHNPMSEIALDQPVESRKPKRRHVATKPQLRSPDQLDGRSNAAKQFDAIADGIAADLGGEDQLTTVQRHLVEAFAGAAIHVNDINARLLLGEKVDIIAHAQAIGVMVRIASRIGMGRVAREVVPSPLDYADADTREAAE